MLPGLLKKCGSQQIVEKQKKLRKFHYHYLKLEKTDKGENGVTR